MKLQLLNQILSGKSLKAFVVILFLIITADAAAQTYEFNLTQRRRFDQIHVEIWAKSLSSSASKLGYASLVMTYNTAYLTPAATQSAGTTDTISYDLQQTNPVVSISSGFSNTNGYSTLGTRAYGTGYYSLEVNLSSLGSGGIVPSTSGRGSFVGKVIFDIINSPSTTNLTQIDWNSNLAQGDIRVFGIDSTDLESQVTFTDPGDFTVVGVSVLSPNQYGLVVDRDENYTSLSGDYLNSGYPVYFERSVSPANYSSGVDEDLAYLFQYSLDNGTSWIEFGRVAETDQTGYAVGNNGKYRTGEIFSSGTVNGYIITTQYGEQLSTTNYRSPVRVVWSKNSNFYSRSEQARLKITRLNGTISSNLSSRSSSSVFDINDYRFILGRLFFVQLDGSTQYLKTESTFSNSTQLTAEAWINLNAYKDYGSETGIVVSSGGPDAAEVHNSKEGAWMLYLKDGRIPAFRAREIEGRGIGGYLADLQAYYLDSLVSISSAEPLIDAHSQNWVHIAATVNNNISKLYVNGELIDDYKNENATDIRLLTTDHPIWIGVNPNDNIEANDYLNAGIKGVKVWRVALTQDELRARVAGVSSPTNCSTYGDLRRGLELYYSLEGQNNDLASDSTYQNGSSAVDLFVNSTQDNSSIKYRPDQSHIRLTAPVGGAGVSNKNGEAFDIRWVSYGMGNINTTGSKDVEIEYSLDGGSNWYYAKNPDGNDLGSTTAPDVETGTVQWEPYENNNSSANLRTLNPYSKPAILRIRGTAANTQNNLMDVSDEFTVAPYFAIKRSEGSIIALDGEDGMNITGNTVFIEAWIKPYRFPTETEGAAPIIVKMDSTANAFHYALNLLPTGQLQFKITDAANTVRTAVSDASIPLEKPKSVNTDSSWTHIGVYLFLNNGVGASEIRFYIDGVAQRADSITTQLGDQLIVNSINKYPTYIGYKPSYTITSSYVSPGRTLPTRYVEVSGNLNGATPVGNSRSVAATIYDTAGLSRTLNMTFTKYADNQYDFSSTLDGNSIPRQTQQMSMSGNLSTDNEDGTQSTFTTSILDYQNTARTLSVLVTKEPSSRYSFDVSIDGTLINENNVAFNLNGDVAVPSELILSASDINTALGNTAFNQTLPQNVTISLENLTAQAGDETAVIAPVTNRIIFNEDGTISTPLAFTIYAYDLNQAINTNAFDDGNNSNITVMLAEAANLSLGLTNTQDPDNLSATARGNDSVVSDTVTVLEDPLSFVGEMREIRFWSGTPNNTLTSGTEPTEMSNFIGGALTVRSASLQTGYKNNLNRAFSFNGGSFTINGYHRAVAYSSTADVVAKYYGVPVTYVATEPYIKVVEPTYKEQIANTKTDVKVRWVGFDYDGTGFKTGEPTEPPSLEFSIRGGGGKIIQPYQYLGSNYWVGNSYDAMSLVTTSAYMFQGTGSNIYFACNVDASIADPDVNDDGLFGDQGPLSAALTNARFRMNGKYTVNGETRYISSEGPLFTVTPASNFTVRVLLEGYHNGSTSGNDITNLASAYDQGGLKIYLFEDNSGGIGTLVDSAESINGYDNQDPLNKNAGNYRFANVNFVFTELTDGDYWVLVTHPNHMPVLSRFAAPFFFSGDSRSTWAIESGWNFISWNGTDNNVLPSVTTIPSSAGYFSAYGDAYSTNTDPQYSTTSLNYNNGVAGGSANSMAAMVGGDVEKDGQINAADRVRVRLDEGTGLVRSDVTGDGFVNADDRTICDRNYGKVSILPTLPLKADSEDESPMKINTQNPFDVISELDPERSMQFIEAAKSMKNKNDKIKFNMMQAGISYDVWGVIDTSDINNEVLGLKFYIQNKGSDFALANCTFAVTYNSNYLTWYSLDQEENNIYDNQPEYGYAKVNSAPDEIASNPLPDVRTIEIDYDAYANPDGITLPTTPTYIGTLKFKLKSRTNIIDFDWHASTSVHSTKQEIVTPYGNFLEFGPWMPYWVQINKPQAGDFLRPEKEYVISWSTNGSSNVYLEYTTNNGSSWTLIEEAGLKALSYNWTTPDVNSSNCMVRMVDIPTGITVSQSGVFSIMPAFARITRPSSGDPIYNGGTNDYIRWTSQGLGDVRFEFSADAGSSWKTITPQINSADGSLSWKLPNVTTKSAIVRMIDLENGEEAAQSGIFKILDGTLSIIDPKYNDNFKEGSIYRIRWISKDVQEFDLDLSVDGGNSWERIFSEVQAKTVYVSWKADKEVTSNAIIRAIWNGDPEMEYDRTDRFNIISGIEEKLPEGYAAGEFFPNPAVGTVSLNITLPVSETLSFNIYNAAGEHVDSRQNHAGEGISNISLDFSMLSSGVYFVHISSESMSTVRTLNIVK